MSADLLLRAAAKLRKDVDDLEAASPWTAETYRDGRAWVTVPGAVHAWGMHGFTGEARYVATMHPPVALALADWLEDEAEQVDDDGELYCVSGATLGVARAVLREDGESR